MTFAIVEEGKMFFFKNYIVGFSIQKIIKWGIILILIFIIYLY
jgi:hypothetical protein